MKVLVYGSKGWIGNQFINILKELEILFVCGKARIDDIPSLEAELDQVAPTHIVSFIGRTHGVIGSKAYTTIDYLEQEGKLVENVRDNLFAPLVLCEVSQKRGIHYTYLGTGCIFKYDEAHPFGEERNGFDEAALPNFFGSSYSVVKGFTDRLMAFQKNVLNLRIRMPITGEKNPRNFITKITTYEKVCSAPNSMTVLPELLPFVVEMMKMKQTGTVNLTNPGLISHNEILDMYTEIVDPNFTYRNFTQAEQRAILAADRSNNYLDTTKLEALFPQVKPIKESVREMLLKYKASLLPGSLLVTGGAGFIGSNFINHFCTKHPEVKVTNLDALYYCANEENVCEAVRTSPNYRFVKGNLQNYELLEALMKEHQFTHVIHFAAQSHVQNSFEGSFAYTDDNVRGTHHLLEVCRKHNPRLVKFVHCSTDEVYGESLLDVEETHKTEQSILSPTNPYAATKAAAEMLVNSYHHSFGMPVVITRGNNVYGPNQYPEKLIPRFIKLLQEGKKVTIQGDGSCVRAFLHVDDTARAFETILMKGRIGEVYNIGCDEGMEYSVMDVAKMLIKRIHDTEDYDAWIEYIEDRPFNDQRYYISNQKLKDLGWNIIVGFEEGIEQLIYGKYKIDKNILNSYTNILNFFGDWTNDDSIQELSTIYKNSEPFSHIRIDNFLNLDYANKAYENFPLDIENWHKYCNPIEVKYANNNIDTMPDSIRDIFYALSTKELQHIFSKITGVETLEVDPYLHGAGLHVHPKHGRLNLHLDYEKHPILCNKQRRVNIILFLTKDWKKEWGGDNQLWDENECKVRTYPTFNSAIIFQTNEISWHGIPEIVTCPDDTFRKSLAYYYTSPLEEEEKYE